MCRHAGAAHLEPADTLDAIHDGDRHARGFEHGSLLNMQFDIAMRGGLQRPARNVGRGCKHGIEGFTEAHPMHIARLAITREQRRIDERARAHRPGREAAALLVRPRNDLNRTLRRHACAIERTQYFESRQHPIRTIEASTGGLSIDMASDQDRWEWILAFTPKEQVRTIVDISLPAAFVRLVQERVPRARLERREGFAPYTSIGEAAVGGKPIDRGTEPVAIDQACHAGGYRLIVHAVIEHFLYLHVVVAVLNYQCVNSVQVACMERFACHALLRPALHGVRYDAHRFTQAHALTRHIGTSDGHRNPAESTQPHQTFLTRRDFDF